MPAFIFACQLTCFSISAFLRRADFSFAQYAREIKRVYFPPILFRAAAIVVAAAADAASRGPRD